VRIRFLLPLFLPLFVVLAAPHCSRGSAAPRTVLLITVDSLRADRIGADPAVTPTLDALAREGMFFDRVLTPIPAGRPALASLMSGLSPARHRVRFAGHVLFRETVTVAERLAEAGFETAAFVPALELLVGGGLGQGFLEQVGSDEDGANGADVRTDRAVAWLDAGAAAGRFAWVHFDEPTAPYLPSRAAVDALDPDYAGPYADRFAFFDVDARGLPTKPENRRLHEHVQALMVFGERRLSARDHARVLALYDAEVRDTDARIGRLIAAAGEDALVVVVGTHGESLGEHGYFYDHGETLAEPTLRVPLVVRGPGVEVGRSSAQLGLIDVGPTILDQLVLPSLGAGAGRSFAAALEGAAVADRGLFAESAAPLAAMGNPRLKHLPTEVNRKRARNREMVNPALRLRAYVMASGRKFVLDPIIDELRAYDLRSDPGEEVDRAGDPAFADDTALARAVLEAMVTIVAIERAQATTDGEPAPEFPKLDADATRLLVGEGVLEE